MLLPQLLLREDSQVAEDDTLCFIVSPQRHSGRGRHGVGWQSSGTVCLQMCKTWPRSLPPKR